MIALLPWLVGCGTCIGANAGCPTYERLRPGTFEGRMLEPASDTTDLPHDPESVIDVVVTDDEMFVVREDRDGNLWSAHYVLEPSSLD